MKTMWSNEIILTAKSKFPCLGASGACPRISIKSSPFFFFLFSVSRRRKTGCDSKYAVKRRLHNICANNILVINYFSKPPEYMNFLSGSAAAERLLHRRRLPTFVLDSKVCFMFKGVRPRGLQIMSRKEETGKHHSKQLWACFRYK